jgi:hypothetical protein
VIAVALLLVFDSSNKSVNAAEDLVTTWLISLVEVVCEKNSEIIPCAQTERRGDAGLVRDLFGGRRHRPISLLCLT